jgi:hypothetical protein
MRDATSSDGPHVVLKLVDGDSDELAILEHLNEIRSAANHTIELHGVVDITVTKVIALLWRISLNEYFSLYCPPKSAASSPEQFLEGVAFLHEHRVTHLDPKLPPRVLIDFDLSVFVEDEHTTIEGFRGTPTRVAPEVGTLDQGSRYISCLVQPGWTRPKIWRDPCRSLGVRTNDVLFWKAPPRRW